MNINIKDYLDIIIMKNLICFDNKICINNLPSVCILFINILFFYSIQYILTTYIIHSSQSLLIFIFGSFLVFALYYVFDYLLLLFSRSYYLIDTKEKRSYVLSNLIKSGLLLVYTPNAIYILYETMYNDNWNNLKIKNMGSLYAIPDFVSLFMVNNMNSSTKIHHIVVVIFYICNLMNDYNKENVFRPLTVYAIFSTLAYSVNLTLAIRFFKKKKYKENIDSIIFLCIS